MRLAWFDGADCDGQVFARDGVVRYSQLASYFGYQLAIVFCRDGYLRSAAVRPNKYVFPGRNHSFRPREAWLD